MLSNIFVRILSIGKRLIKLNFCASCRYRHLFVRIANLRSTSWISSTLTTLKMNFAVFNDCLRLLDGRLSCLSTLIIHVEWIIPAKSNIRNTVNLISMICLSRYKQSNMLNFCVLFFINRECFPN
jgi:hypothetical protein